jgi:hypothetical protein
MDFRLPVKLEDCRKGFEEIVVPGNLGKTTRAILAMAGNPASVSCDFLFSSRDSHLAQDMSNQKQTGVIPGKDLCHGRHYALNYFREFYLQPVYRAASARFPLFSRHTQLFSRTPFLFFLAYASQHLPMLRLRPRFKPKPCACGARRQRACLARRT